MKILVEKAVIEQALEALEKYAAWRCTPETDQTITTLREALDPELWYCNKCGKNHCQCPPWIESNYKPVEQAEQEPVAPYEMLTDDEIQMLWVNWDANRTSEWYECIEDLVHVVEDYIIQKQTEINPLGYLDESDLRGLAQGNAVWIYPEDQGRMVAIYAAPVRTKDLTDDEITNEWESMGRGLGKYTEFARAVIAADRKKNR